MADEKAKKVKEENKIIEGFQLGLGIYVAFLAGTVILGILTTLIWWLFMVTR